MNITNDVEVSTPFFHENNTAAMNMTYETPVQSEAGQSGEENILAHVMQTSINHAARMKEYYEECACGYRCFATYGSILCRAILNNAEKEYEKLEKSKEIMMQHIRPMAPMETENTNPTPWRWVNRTEVPVEERGKCLLYRPVAYMHAFDEHNFDHRIVDRYNFDPNTFNQHVIDQHMSRQTPVCLLRENDVVDNGTVMCLHAFGNECVYGNETMKAIMEMERLYHPEIPAFKFPEFPAIPEMSQTTWFVLIVLFFFFVGTLQRSV